MIKAHNIVKGSFSVMGEVTGIKWQACLSCPSPPLLAPTCGNQKYTLLVLRIHRNLSSSFGNKTKIYT